MMETSFVRCQLVARDIKPQREGPRDDFFAPMPKKALFAIVACMRERRRERRLAEVKLVFVDVKKAHFSSRCDEEERVELTDETEEHRKVRKNCRDGCTA